MRRRTHATYPWKNLGLVLATGSIGLGFPGVCAPSEAQPPSETRVMVTQSVAGPGARSTRLSARNIEKYADVLGMSSDQREVARLLFDGYSHAYQQASDERRDRTQALMRSFQDSQDASIMAEEMPAVQRAFTERTRALERSLFDDLRAILTSEQESRFEQVQRLRRREVGLMRATLSGEGVDLHDVITGLSLSPDTTKVIADSLEQYEMAMDRVLKERDELLDTFMERAGVGAGMMNFGPEAIERMREAREKGREAATRVRDVNRTYARLLASQLPEETAAKFNEEVKRRSFAQVYREPHVVKSLQAASGFSDLSADQRRTIQDLMASYNREAVSINDRWARAIEANEESGSDSVFAMGDMSMRFSMGSEPDDLREARTARRELDDRISERLSAALTEDQRNRLPKATPQAFGIGGPFIGGEREAVIIQGGGG